MTIRHLPPAHGAPRVVLRVTMLVLVLLALGLATGGLVGMLAAHVVEAVLAQVKPAS